MHTPRLLEVLAEHRAQATFFVIGRWAEREPALLRELTAAGHALGNHTHTHPTLPRLPAAAVADERLDRCRDAVESAGVGFSTVGRADADAPAVRPPPPGHAAGGAGAGYLPVTWSITCCDWRAGKSAGPIAHRGLPPRPAT